jgi:uncharacterized protein YlzI (FlbEa/FlbD family)
LEELILDSDRRIELGRKGRDWVVKRHDVERVVDRLYSYYKEVGLV